MKLLLLEDDAAAIAHITSILRSNGHVVDLANSGPEAIFLATTHAYAVLVLDRMVPGVDGLAALKAIRAAGVQTPALFLTAMGDIVDRVAGLNAGADDYLCKPFAASELIARIAALGRRSRQVDTLTRVVIADLEIDLLTRQVTRAGRRITLQHQEYRLLEFLARHAGEVVTRAMMLESIWDFHFEPGTNLVESHISRLRGKIDRGFDVDLIHTVRGAGYRLDAPR